MALLWDEIAKDGSLNLFFVRKLKVTLRVIERAMLGVFYSVLLLQDPH